MIYDPVQHLRRCARRSCRLPRQHWPAGGSSPPRARQRAIQAPAPLHAAAHIWGCSCISSSVLWPPDTLAPQGVVPVVRHAQHSLLGLACTRKCKGYAGLQPCAATHALLSLRRAGVPSHCATTLGRSDARQGRGRHMRVLSNMAACISSGSQAPRSLTACTPGRGWPEPQLLTCLCTAGPACLPGLLLLRVLQLQWHTRLALLRPPTRLGRLHRSCCVGALRLCYHNRHQPLLVLLASQLGSAAGGAEAPALRGCFRRLLPHVGCGPAPCWLAPAATGVVRVSC